MIWIYTSITTAMTYSGATWKYALQKRKTLNEWEYFSPEVCYLTPYEIGQELGGN